MRRLRGREELYLDNSLLFNFNVFSPSSLRPQGFSSVVGALILFTCLCEMRAFTFQKVL